VDSLAVSVKWQLSASKTNADFDEKTNCVVDPALMKYNPIRLKLWHYDTTTSLRKILWHEDDIITNVSSSDNPWRDEMYG
jgi:hypothetical protein